MLGRVSRLLVLTAALALLGCELKEAPEAVAPQPKPAATEPVAKQAPVTIQGRVESSDPKAFGTQTARLQDPLPWLNLLGSPAYADVNFYAVVDVPVRVYPIASAGYIYGPPVAVATTTTMGYYTVPMPTTYVYQPVTEYVLVAGGPVIVDRIDDWNDLGDFALRRLVTGLVDQVISPVTEVVYLETIPFAQTQVINVHTIPVQQVVAYETHVYQEVEQIVFPRQVAPVVVVQHIHHKIKGKPQLIVERDQFLTVAHRLTPESRAADLRDWEQSRERLKRSGTNSERARSLGQGAPDRTRTEKADGGSGRDNAPRTDHDPDGREGSSQKSDRGGGGNAPQADRGGGSSQKSDHGNGGGGGNTQKSDRGRGGGDTPKADRGDGGGGGSHGGGNSQKSDRGRGGDDAPKADGGGGGGGSHGGGNSQKSDRGRGGGNAPKADRGGGGGGSHGGGNAPKADRGGGGGNSQKSDRGGGGGGGDGGRGGGKR